MNKLKTKNLIIAFIVLSAAASAALIFYFKSPEFPVIYFSKDGFKFIFNKKDIALISQMKNCYITEPEASLTAPEESAISLFEPTFYKFAAYALNVYPKEEDLKKENERIDRETKAPEILDCVKKVFSQNRKKYDDFFVAPGLLNRIVRRTFSLSPEIQKNPRQKIESLRAEVSATPSKFNEIGKTAPIFNENVAYPPSAKEGGKTPDVLAPYFPQEDYSNDPLIINVLSKMKPGEIFSSIVEDDDFYKLVKLVSKKDNSYVFSAIAVPKEKFDPWFIEINKTAAIKIYDKEFYGKIAEKYSDVWWFKQIKPSFSIFEKLLFLLNLNK